MGNLIKISLKISFLIAIFSAIILSFSLFAEKAIAESVFPISTPTPTPPACAALCGTTNCATCPDGTRICGTQDLNTCPAPTPTPVPAKLIWQQIADCTSPIATPTPLTPPASCWATTQADWDTYCIGPINLHDLCTESGQVKCIDSKQRILCCKPPLLTPTPTPNLFDCERLIAGPYEGNYACYAIKSGSVQCPSGWTEFTDHSPFTATSCNSGQRCCKQNPLTSPTPTAPTPQPSNTSLSFTINLSDLTTKHPGQVIKNLNVEVLDPITDNKVSESIVSVKYDSQTGKFTGGNSINWVPASGIYNIKVKIPGYLKTTIPSQTITVAQQNTVPVVLQPGDINGDNVIDILDYNNLSTCFGKKFNLSSCADKNNADLNDDGAIDGIDYNIFIKAFASGKRVGD